MKCPICNHSGGNMLECKKCGKVFCRPCANKGLINGKKVAANQCPHCGAYNSSKPAK